MVQRMVLLVEDNDFTRSTVASALAAENCTGMAVRSAKEALSVASSTSFDCAVIDLHLGTGPNGIDVAHALRKIDRDLGIVLLTSYEDPRLLGGEQRALPEHTVYVVKNSINSTGALRAKIDEACELGGQVRSPVPGQVPLTDGQVEVLRLVALGCTNAEIARRKVVSERSVETSLARIARRLGLDPEPGENPRVLLVQRYHQLIGGSSNRER